MCFPKLDKVIGSLVKGPNGPAIITAHYDALAVLRDNALHNALNRFATLAGNGWIMDLMRGVAKNTPNGDYKHSRLALLAQGGGKTRVIAIGDY